MADWLWPRAVAGIFLRHVRVQLRLRAVPLGISSSSWLFWPRGTDGRADRFSFTDKQIDGELRARTE
jgi:hypothetical protein